MLFDKIRDDHLSRLNEQQLEIRNIIQDEKASVDKVYRFIIDNNIKGNFLAKQLVDRFTSGHLYGLIKQGIVVQNFDSPYNHCINDTRLSFIDLEPMDFTYNEQTNDRVMIIVNDIKYKGIPELIQGYCPVLNDLSNGQTIEITDPDIDRLTVITYLQMYYRLSIDHVGVLDSEQLMGFCRLIDRYPVKIVTVENLEEMICKGYDDRFTDYYVSLISRYNMKNLLKCFLIKQSENI